MKRIIKSILLAGAVTALFCLFTLQSSAATYSGSCGSSANWFFDTTTKVLSITGSGAIYSYDWSDEVPWYDHREDVKSVIIGSGITRIGEKAFYGCKKLTVVVIPNSVTSIGFGAFCDCDSLKTVVMPGSVTTIEGSVFYDCDSLKTIAIPSGVTTIESETFARCDNLESIILPNSVKEVGNSAFDGCSSLAYVFYSGTSEEADDIYIDSYNSSITGADWYLNAVDEYMLYEGQEKSVSLSAGESRTLAFVPAKSGQYSIYSTGDYDTYGYLLSSSQSQLTSNDDDGSGSNFKISYSLTAGSIYYVKVKFYSTSRSGSFSVFAQLNDSSSPTGSISSTNNLSSSQTVTLSLSDDSGIAGYYWGTSFYYSSNTFTSTTSTSVNKTVTNSGTYYFTVKDNAGNVSSTYSITFYKTTVNTGASKSSVLTKSGNSFTPKKPAVVSGKCRFVGWSRSSTDTTGTTSISPSGNYTYYAVFADHSYTQKNTSSSYRKASATCTKGTTYYYLCSACGVKGTKTFTSGSALGHSYTKKSTSKTYLKSSATCTKGNTYFYCCSRCSAKGTKTFTSGSALGHSYTKKTTTKTYLKSAATCTKAAVYYYCCSRCTAKGTKTYSSGSVKHSYKTTTVKATLSKDGKVKRVCSACKKTTTSAVKKVKSIKLNKTDLTYNGKAQTVTVTVKDSAGKALKLNTDYTVSGNKNTKSNQYKATVTLKGKYSGTKKLIYYIRPTKATISSLTPGKGSFTVKWKSVSANNGDHYYIQYSTSKDFKTDVKSLNGCVRATLGSWTVTGLKAGKTYYVRLCAAKNVGTTSNVQFLYSSSWSDAKSVKVK